MKYYLLLIIKVILEGICILILWTIPMALAMQLTEVYKALSTANGYPLAIHIVWIVVLTGYNRLRRWRITRS